MGVGVARLVELGNAQSAPRMDFAKSHYRACNFPLFMLLFRNVGNQKEASNYKEKSNSREGYRLSGSSGGCFVQSN